MFYSILVLYISETFSDSKSSNQQLKFPGWRHVPPQQMAAKSVDFLHLNTKAKTLQMDNLQNCRKKFVIFVYEVPTAGQDTRMLNLKDQKYQLTFVFGESTKI